MGGIVRWRYMTLRIKKPARVVHCVRMRIYPDEDKAFLLTEKLQVKSNLDAGHTCPDCDRTEPPKTDHPKTDPQVIAAPVDCPCVTRTPRDVILSEKFNLKEEKPDAAAVRGIDEELGSLGYIHEKIR